jgi:hypothetical protein
MEGVLKYLRNAALIKPFVPKAVCQTAAQSEASHSSEYLAVTFEMLAILSFPMFLIIFPYLSTSRNTQQATRGPRLRLA